MKKLKLLFAAFALLLGGSNASAQDWTASSVGAGTFYLYNVGGQGFLVGANSWGTQASVDATGGIPVTLAGSGTTYTISTSPTYNGKFLGANGFVDGGTADWTFEAVAGQENVYKLKTGNDYIFAGNTADANSVPKTTTVGADPGTNMAYWKLVSKENLFTTFSSATPESPVAATCLITNPGFGRNINKGYGWTVGASNQNMGGGDQTNQCAEHWQSAFTVKQTISSIPNGIYKLRLQAALTEYVVTGTDFPVVYIKSGSNEGTAKFKTMDNGENSMSAMSASFSAGKYFTDYAEVNVLNGEIEIGVRGTRTDTWCVYDNFQLLYCGPITDLTPYVEAYETALANAKTVAATEETISATVLANLNSVINTYDEGNVDEESQDALETATAALTEATTAANTSIASYAVIAAGSVPDNSLDGWTCENAQTFHINTWSSEGNSDGSNMKTPFIENWVGKGSYLGAGKVYYQLSGLEPGEVYYAQALVRSYNEANSDAPNGPNFFVNDAVTSLSEAGTTFTYSGMSGIYATLGTAATVGEDGILKLGVEIAEDRNYNWVAFKSVSIRPMDDAFDAAVAKVTALEGTIPTAAYNVAYAVVTEWNAKYPTTAAGFEQAISEIEAAAATAAECKAPYAAWKSLKAKADVLVGVANDNAEANSTLASVISVQNTTVEGATVASAIETATTTLKTGMITYVSLANPVGDGAKFDCTFMMVNPDLSGFASWTKVADVDGWYTEQSEEGQNPQVMKNDDVACEKGNAFFEYWSPSAVSNGKFALYNKVESLPAGTYTINCYALATANGVEGANTSAIYFYANDTQGSLISADVLTPASISFVNNTEQDVKIGLKTMEGNQFRWMGLGYVELYKVPEQVYEVSENANYDNTQSGAGKVTLTRTIKEGFNTLVLPFSMTQAEVEAAFGKGSVVYDLNSIDGDTWHFVTYSGISANRPCILKATAAGTSYNFEDRTIVAGAPEHNVVGGGMTGSYAASTTVPEDSYIISGDKLYLVDSAVTIKCTRAYFNTTIGSGARTINLSFDDDVTGIATVEGGEVKKIVTGDIYDLQGRKVKNPSKGIYVVEGKKVVF